MKIKSQTFLSEEQQLINMKIGGKERVKPSLSEPDNAAYVSNK